MSFRRPRGARHLIPVVALLLLGATTFAQSSTTAVSAGSPAALFPTGAGIDISFPQCSRGSHVALPPHTPFAVIGVNGGSAFNSNPCFSSEYNSAFLFAAKTDQPHAALYINTGNPALAGVWWPIGNHTEAGSAVENPNGLCSYLPGAACAYVYGYSMAQADYRRVRKALVQMPTQWWLDVETSNTWQPDVVANAASLSGMVDYLDSKGLVVGLYSTAYQWNRIAGATSATSDLAGLPSWLAGGSFLGAPADCEKSPLTPNGRVAMIQYVKHFDNDYSCERFAAATATISPSGQAVVGSEVTARSGTWGPGVVSYSYQWNRDGFPIPEAASPTYALTATDLGTTVSVTITGREAGFSTAILTSEGIAVVGGATP